ncbi:MAG: protein kinase [Anaeromyxobacter sp.]
MARDDTPGRAPLPPELEGESQALSDLLLALASAPAQDPAELPQPLEPGQVVGRFELLREVGRGGFGVVFEARDRELGRLVAFKAMRASRARADLEKPLREEAEAAARLNHPNVVTLHDFGIHQGTPYLILELLRGETLQQRLRRGPLPAQEAVRVALAVARGLAHAHGEGVVHRDLKPGNVFLTAAGGVKILDFGLARLLDRASLAGGTPAYMAPEQLRGELGDARADVFGLGVLLFQALSGELPYPVREGHSAALDPGPPPPLPLDDVPPELATLVAGALSKDPAGRPQGAGAVVDALLAVERAYAGRAAALARALRRRRLRRVGVAATALLLVAAAGATALALRARAQAEQALRASRVASAADGASDPLVAALLVAELPDDPPPRAMELAQRLLGEPIPYALLEGSPGGMGLAVSPDGRWVAMGSADGGATIWPADGTGGARLLAGGGARTDALAFTPDARRLVTAGHRGQVRSFPLDGRAPLVVEAGDAPLIALRVDPTGRLAAVAALDGRAWLVALDGSRPPRALLHDGAVLALAWSPDGARLATGGGDGFLRIFDAADGALRVRAGLPGGALFHLAWSRDGRRLAVASEDGVARVLGPDGARLEELGDPGPSLATVAFDPEGERLVAAAPEGVHVFRLGQPGGADGHVRLRNAGGGALSAAFLPDGHHLLATGVDGVTRLWAADGLGVPMALRGPLAYEAVASADGARVFTRGKDGTVRAWSAADPRDRGVLRTEALVDTVRWTRDGERLLTAGHDGIARLWPVHGGAALTIHDPGRVIHAADLDRAEQLIATASEDGLVRLWDAHTGALVRELAGHEGPVLSAAFSPDGRQVASVALDRTVRVWPTDGASPPRVFTGHEGGLTGVAWTPDGRAVLSASQLDATVRLWPLDGHPPQLIRGDRAVFRPATLPDGRLLVAEDGGALRVLSADGRRELPALPAVPEGLFTAVASPDGERLALTSTDGTVRVYAADGSGEPLVLRGHEASVGNAAFSPDGAELATASADGTARVFTVDWLRLREQVRGLTSACLPVPHRVQLLGEAPDEAEARLAECHRAHGRTPPQPLGEPPASAGLRAGGGSEG